MRDGGPGDPGVKPLMLNKRTYFYESAIHVRAISEIEPDKSGGRFPLPLWPKLRPLAIEGARKRLSTNDFREWWPEGE
jgi:hypothetical protein